VLVFGGWDPELAATRKNRNKRRRKEKQLPAAGKSSSSGGGGCAAVTKGPDSSSVAAEKESSSSSAYFNDLFVLDTERWFWSECLLPDRGGCPLPSVRTGHSAVFDAPRQRLLVFGGQQLTSDGQDVAFLDDLVEIGPLSVTLAD
jgi:hypothetical protein